MTTIAKVAKRAGVSLTTVSHVLNHADRVSAEMRRRVEVAIAELGYVPNPPGTKPAHGADQPRGNADPGYPQPLLPGTRKSGPVGSPGDGGWIY
ncbi:LacI family DNA-binding transcriptional regulator (plasmid) [Sinorhizobium meliloti]|nr:LacI family DNA-binding transcriptional regulator [Sinorhizobium meliloti]